MVRSMYSGVSGLRTHQTRMDTIGNNIANVNTYGYKSTRTTFRDIYYQNLKGASGPTAAQGGVNASQVGYGSQVGSIDLMMSRSTFSMTDQTMDMAVDGDGFFQVQDANGNTYYTRAGMLNFDAAGNLVDMQGNYVLGVNGDPTGRGPSSERITVALPAVQPSPGKVVQTINGKEYTISASNNTIDSNINFNFTSDSTLADGVTAKAQISTTGIIVTFNANETFNNWGDVNAAINDAIKAANGGKEHVGGQYNVTYTGDPAKNPFNVGNLPTGRTYLTGAELASTDYATQYGNINLNVSGTPFGGITPTGSVGSAFSGNGTISAYKCVFTSPTSATVTMTINGVDYTGIINDTRTGSGKFNLVNGSNTNDYIEMNRPSFNDLVAAWKADTSSSTDPIANSTFTAITINAGSTAKPSSDSFALGLSSTALTLKGGTAGGSQTIADMTGISIAANGTIIGLDSQGTEVIIGRIDLATFANQNGLYQSGSTAYAESPNSGRPQVTIPGTDGAGQLVGGTLELSNVDLSREFSDMITTQRGYQANSRIITVSDTMLEELINLKR